MQNASITTSPVSSLSLLSNSTTRSTLIQQTAAAPRTISKKTVKDSQRTHAAGRAIKLLPSINSHLRGRRRQSCVGFSFFALGRPQFTAGSIFCVLFHRGARGPDSLLTLWARPPRRTLVCWLGNCSARVVCLGFAFYLDPLGGGWARAFFCRSVGWKFW